jgi:hypothetical protein
MGDKSPKANAKQQKQQKAEKNQKQADAKIKQTPPAAAIPGKRSK